MVRNPELGYDDVDASELCEFNGWDYDIESTSLNCFELNKYSEEKVWDYFLDNFGGYLECTFERSQPTVAEATHSMLDIYGDGWNSLIYVQEADEKQGKYSNWYELTFWIPEDDLNNFLSGALYNGYPVKICSQC